MRVAESLALKILLRRPDDAFLLGACDTFSATAIVSIFAESDFSEYKAISVLHDQVNLSRAATEIARYGLQTACVKI